MEIVHVLKDFLFLLFSNIYILLVVKNINLFLKYFTQLILSIEIIVLLIMKSEFLLNRSCLVLLILYNTYSIQFQFENLF